MRILSRAGSLLLLLLLLLLPIDAAPQRPNIVWFLTDDQDQMLGASFPELRPGSGPMPRARRHLQAMGATAERFYVHTPICNPSRAELLSGRYFHNIKRPGGALWSMHVDEQRVAEESFVKDLHDKAGYITGLFGKYLNTLPEKVPQGYDVWVANDGGSYIAPEFQLYNASFLQLPGLTSRAGTHKGAEVPSPSTACWRKKDSPSINNFNFSTLGQNHRYGCFKGSTDPSNYSTAVIGNASVAFIRNAVRKHPERPFFAYIAPKAAHEPFNPAPWYESHWDESWPKHEPRNNPAWNATAEDRKGKHGIIPSQPMITHQAAQIITDVFKNRWRTLMSVDDLIGDVVTLCEDLGVAENTYFFFSSDHGFQLGQNNILMDKRHVYEWNTKVHFLARGPGILPGSTWSWPATQVDLAATFTGIAGVPYNPERFDGKSIAPLLIRGSGGGSADRTGSVNGSSNSDSSTLDSKSSGVVPAGTRRHLEEMAQLSGGGRDSYAKQWRDHVFFEYYFVNDNNKCVAQCPRLEQQWLNYPLSDSFCGDLTAGKNSRCWSGKNWCTECYATESASNNFRAVRFMPGSSHGDTLYAEFQRGSLYNTQRKKTIDFARPDFYEMYDNSADPWMMHNLVADPRSPPLGGAKMRDTLNAWYSCKGSSCF
jgi:N-acetylglucosamine-6-sulfatase